MLSLTDDDESTTFAYTRGRFDAIVGNKGPPDVSGQNVGTNEAVRVRTDEDELRGRIGHYND